MTHAVRAASDPSASTRYNGFEKIVCRGSGVSRAGSCCRLTYCELSENWRYRIEMAVFDRPFSIIVIEVPRL